VHRRAIEFGLVFLVGADSILLALVVRDWLLLAMLMLDFETATRVGYVRGA